MTTLIFSGFDTIVVHSLYMSTADTYPNCEIKKKKQNMLNGSFKFMSPVNNVWELSTLNDNLQNFRIDTIVVH